MSCDQSEALIVPCDQSESAPCLHLPLAELDDVGDDSDGLVDAVREEPERGDAELTHQLLEVC